MSWEDPNEEREYRRRRALKALRIYFANKRSPRLMMSAVLLLTGATGFLASYLMLRAGVHQMWLRYPAALVFAWAAFLPMVRLWAEFERRSLPEMQSIEKALQGRDPAETMTRLKDDRDWSWLDWLDIPGDLFAEAEGCLAGLALLAGAVVVLAAGFAVVNVIVAAPLLIAEVFLDAVLLTALYKRMGGLEQRWWLDSAIRHTLKPVILTAIGLAVAGAVMHSLAPEARSIGGVWHHYHAAPLEDDPGR